MKQVSVHITWKEDVLDPQGKTTKDSLHALGFHEVREAQVSKYIELEVEPAENLEERIMEMCEKLLTNPVIEKYSFKIQDMGEVSR